MVTKLRRKLRRWWWTGGREWTHESLLLLSAAVLLAFAIFVLDVFGLWYQPSSFFSLDRP